MYRCIILLQCYWAFGSATPDDAECPNCGTAMGLERHLSFVDCPGHDILMATMLNGAAVMDGAMLLVAANESCPQPQTSEHLAAVEIMQLKHLVILQNKIDLVSQSAAQQQAHDIREFVKGTMAERAPVVPISAQLKYNIDVVVEYLIKKIPGDRLPPVISLRRRVLCRSLPWWLSDGLGLVVLHGICLLVGGHLIACRPWDPLPVPLCGKESFSPVTFSRPPHHFPNKRRHP